MHTHRTAQALATAGAGLALAGLLAAGCGGNGHEATAVIDPGDNGHYAPHVDPAAFVTTIDNPYLPLRPGMTWDYTGPAGKHVETDHVEVTDQTRTIMGIPAVVVRDTVSVKGKVTEDTYDWYAQDRSGNVWYLGEDTREYGAGGKVDTGGSWEAGKGGALPGIVMPAHPAAGRAYRQEFLAGEAEDLAQVTKLGTTRTVPAGSYKDVVVTKEWSPLEPSVIEAKYYAPGVGMIREEALAGPTETSQLTGFQP
jgi:hypothetical protein